MAYQNHSKDVKKVSFQYMHGLMFVKKIIKNRLRYQLRCAKNHPLSTVALFLWPNCLVFGSFLVLQMRFYN
jgi:hypothetical protein